MKLLAPDLTETINKRWHELSVLVTPRQAHILDCRYRRNLTLQETADKLFCSRRTVSQLESVAIRKIRKYLKEKA